MNIFFLVTLFMGTVFLEKPVDYKESMAVSATFLFNDCNVLLLKTMGKKKHANTWAAPAGKVKPNETIKEAALRELWEETHYALPPENLHYFKTVYVRHPNADFSFPIFYAFLEEPFEPILRPEEHEEWRWVPLDEIPKMNLMADEPECLQLLVDYLGLKCTGRDLNP